MASGADTGEVTLGGDSFHVRSHHTTLSNSHQLLAHSRVFDVYIVNHVLRFLKEQRERISLS